MRTNDIIKGASEDQIWKKLGADILKNPMVFEYRRWIHHGKYKIFLEIDIDLGGGFESGYSSTRFIAQLKAPGDFSFSVTHEGLIEKVEKYFGMQDIIIGYPAFDKKFIIKSNNDTKVKSIFSDKAVRDSCISLGNFSFTFGQRHVPNRARKKSILELKIEEGITNPIRLRKIYKIFYSTLKKIEP